MINLALVINIYGGPESDLASNAPEGVEVIYRGWTPEVEAELLALCESEGIGGVSCLPCLLVRTISGVKEVRIADMPQPWDWNTIMNAADAIILAANTPEEES